MTINKCLSITRTIKVSCLSCLPGCASQTGFLQTLPDGRQVFPSPRQKLNQYKIINAYSNSKNEIKTIEELTVKTIAELKKDWLSKINKK